MIASITPRLRHAGLAVLAALLTGGCVEPLGPPNLAGTYVLVAFNGAVPPHLASPEVVVVADTLRLRADGAGTWTAVRHVYPADGPAREFQREEIRVGVIRREGALVLVASWGCGSGECRTPELGGSRVSRVGDQLSVERSAQVFTLQRIAP